MTHTVLNDSFIAEVEECIKRAQALRDDLVNLHQAVKDDVWHTLPKPLLKDLCSKGYDEVVTGLLAELETVLVFGPPARPSNVLDEEA